MKKRSVQPGMALAGILSACLLAMPGAWAEASSKLTRVWVNMDGNIELEVQGMGFDPLMRLEKGKNGMYDIIIDGEDIALTDAVRAEVQRFAQELSGKMPAIAGVNYYQQNKNGEGIRIVLSSYRKLQPQVLSNSGNRVLLTLVGDRSLPPNIRAKQQAVVPQPQPVQPAQKPAVQASSRPAASVPAQPSRPMAASVDPEQARLEAERESLYRQEQLKLQRQREEENRRQMERSAAYGKKKMVVVPPPSHSEPAYPSRSSQSIFEEEEVTLDVSPSASAARPTSGSPAPQTRIPLDPDFPPLQDDGWDDGAPGEPIKLRPGAVEASMPPALPQPERFSFLDEPMPEPIPAPKTALPPISPGHDVSMMASAAPKSPALFPAPLDEGNAGAIARQAQAAIQEGNLSGAQAVLENHLKTMPQDVAARYLLAQIHVSVAAQSKDVAEVRSRRQAAMQELNAIVSGQAHLPATLSLVDIHFTDGNFTEARRLLNNALVHWPDEPVVHAYFGQAEELSGNLEAAREAYNRAIVAEPANAEFHYRLALVELKAGRLEAARWQLSRSLAIAPDDSRAWKLMGYIAERENKPDAAGDYYRRALNPDAMINYGRLLQRRREPDKALKVYEAVEQMAPNDSDVLFNLGMIYAEMKEKRRAQAVLGRYLDLQAKLPSDERHHGMGKAKSTLSQLK